MKIKSVGQINKKILFVTYGGGHVNMVIPVVKALDGNKVIKIDCDILAMTTARRALELNDIPCFSFRDLSVDAEAKDYGGILTKGQKMHSSIPLEESVAYMGWSYQCLVHDYGEEVAKILYEKHGRQAFLPVKLMERLIIDGVYDLVVATNSPRSERASIIAASNVGIPSVCIVDLFALQEVKWIGERGYSKKVCVFSDYVKRLLIEAGRDSDDIAVTGNPAFDGLADYNHSSVAMEMRRRKGWAGKKLVLWCSQVEPEIHPFTGERGDVDLPGKILRTLEDACKKNEGWHLLVRKHPSELTSGLPSAVEDCSSDVLNDLLIACDAVVTMSSTVALEACLLGKPVATVDLSIFTKDAPFSDMGISYGIKNLDNIESSVKLMMSNDFVIPNRSLPNVGEGAVNVCNEILKILK
jgi:hypothetical protein